MRLNLFRREEPKVEQKQVGVVIISASCCIPGMAAFDEQARKVVEQAIAETGVAARVEVMPATKAYFGGAPKEVMARLMSDSNQGKLSVPAILLNGKDVSYGVPELEDLKAALLLANEAGSAKEKKGDE